LQTSSLKNTWQPVTNSARKQYKKNSVFKIKKRRKIGNIVTIHFFYTFIIILAMAMPLYCFPSSTYTFSESISFESFDHHQVFFILTAIHTHRKKTKPNILKAQSRHHNQKDLLLVIWDG